MTTQGLVGLTNETLCQRSELARPALEIVSSDALHRREAFTDSGSSDRRRTEAAHCFEIEGPSGTF